MKKLAAATMTAGFALALTAGGAAHADEIDWTASQQCVQFDGTLLAEGSFEIVWPHEAVEPNGYVIPAEATGTLLNGYNWPCGPLVTEPVPVVDVAPVAPVAAVKLVTPAADWISELQAFLIWNGGW